MDAALHRLISFCVKWRDRTGTLTPLNHKAAITLTEVLQVRHLTTFPSTGPVHHGQGHYQSLILP